MRAIRLIVCLFATLLFTRVMVAQEAYVYDNTAKGTYLYDASSTGKLTLVSGSPFKTIGTMIGTNGKFLVTADATVVYAYAVGSNGAIGKLVSKINTQLYSGYQCGTIGGLGLVLGAGEFDHTGANIYIPLTGAEDGNACDSLQTYGISTTGFLTFKGATEYNQDNNGTTGAPSLPIITGNGKFAYGSQGTVFNESCGPSIDTYAAESGGVLGYQTESEGPLPALPPGIGYGGWVFLGAMTDDPTDHLAMAMYTTTDFDCEDSPTLGPPQLASATVNSQGVIASTNTYENMPTLAGNGYPASMVLDYTGKILAVATGTGVQFFHFNGASPITKFTGIIGVSGHITHMSWDKYGHLYAQNSSGKMHVYAVTTTSVKELSGSPTVIPIGISSFVVRSL